MGSPTFTSSAIKTGSGSTYQVTFTAPGTYQYDCAVHGTMMTGTIVVK
jgi:plastocyanin